MMMISVSTKPADLVLFVLLGLAPVAQAANRAGCWPWYPRRRRGRQLQVINYFDGFNGNSVGAGQTAFEYVESSIVSEKATEVQQRQILFLNDAGEFLPICTAACDGGFRNYLRNTVLGSAGYDALFSNPFIGPQVDSIITETCGGPLPDFDSIITSYGFLLPAELVSLLTVLRDNLTQPICPCVFNDCDFDSVSVTECLSTCSAVEQPSEAAGYGDAWQEEMCNEFCEENPVIPPAEKEICQDACDCVFRCSEDTTTDFDDCKAECTSTYNGYVVFDFLLERGQRLSDCVYEDKQCTDVLNDWNKDGCEIECVPNPDYDASAEEIAANFDVLRQNICRPTANNEACAVGPFCDYEREEDDPKDLITCLPDAGVRGDPHFKKWNGKWYDFHGICDLLLIRSPSFADNFGLEIHIRTKPRYEYSYIEAAAIKIGNDVLEIGSWGQYWLNGVESAKLPKPMANKYVVNRVTNDEKQHKFVIVLDESQKESIVVNVFKDMVNVNVENATVANFGTSSGLLGSFPAGIMLARDGATVIDDDSLFGQEWQVLADDPQLFLVSSNPDQHVPGVCAPPVATESRRLGEGISMEAAEKACAHHKKKQMRDMCIFDVIAMGDLDVTEIHGAV